MVPTAPTTVSVLASVKGTPIEIAGRAAGMRSPGSAPVGGAQDRATSSHRPLDARDAEEQVRFEKGLMISPSPARLVAQQYAKQIPRGALHPAAAKRNLVNVPSTRICVARSRWGAGRQTAMATAEQSTPSYSKAKIVAAIHSMACAAAHRARRNCGRRHATL